jgi:hypothetical protein
MTCYTSPQRLCCRRPVGADPVFIHQCRPPGLYDDPTINDHGRDVRTLQCLPRFTWMIASCEEGEGPFRGRMSRMRFDTAIVGATLMTGDEAKPVIRDGVLGISVNRFCFVGARSALPDLPAARLIYAAGRLITPVLSTCTRTLCFR